LDSTFVENFVMMLEISQYFPLNRGKFFVRNIKNNVICHTFSNYENKTTVLPILGILIKFAVNGQRLCNYLLFRNNTLSTQFIFPLTMFNEVSKCAIHKTGRGGL
jgi:hypothetical protein